MWRAATTLMSKLAADIPPRPTEVPVPSPDEPESQAPGAPFPDGLHARGRLLWTALGQSLDTSAGQLALEACRTADRLEELDSVIAGKGVLNLMQFRTRGDGFWDADGDQHVHIEVGFQSVLAEARQQQATFKALLVELGMKSTPARPASQSASPLDQLARRRAAK
jgi:hypothetical protein